MKLNLLTAIFAVTFSSVALSKVLFEPFDFDDGFQKNVIVNDSDDANTELLTNKLTAWLKKENVDLNNPVAVTNKIYKSSDNNGDGHVDIDEIKGFLVKIEIGNRFTRGKWAQGLIEAVMGFSAASITRNSLLTYVENTLNEDVRNLVAHNSQSLALVDSSHAMNNSHLNHSPRNIPSFSSESFNHKIPHRNGGTSVRELR